MSKLCALLLILLAGCGPTGGEPTGAELAAASAAGKKVVHIAWDAVTVQPIAQYTVYRGYDCGAGILTTVLTTLTGTDYWDMNVQNKKARKVCYEITATNTAGLEGPHSVRTTTTW